MKNFVFLSPNFPENYWRFCRELKNNGLRVLGIGDCPYENLSQNLKDSLHEYYKVDILENYDAVYGFPLVYSGRMWYDVSGGAVS